MSHNFMSAITYNPKYCKIILSEPLSLIPYELEDHPLRKDYNLPPDYLSIQSEILFIHNVGLYLARLKTMQPQRERIYYLGATHHYFILYFANEFAGHPFEIYHIIPPKGLTDYKQGSLDMVKLIEQCEKEINIQLTKPTLEDHLKKRGRYTNLRFWTQILLMQKEMESSELINPKTQYQIGFESLYHTVITTKSNLQSYLVSK
jgi:hypothetical protein